MHAQMIVQSLFRKGFEIHLTKVVLRKTSGQQEAVEFFLPLLNPSWGSTEKQQRCSATKPEAPPARKSTNILIHFYLLSVI